jgi:hypothetical protein
MIDDLCSTIFSIVLIIVTIPSNGEMNEVSSFKVISLLMKSVSNSILVAVQITTGNYYYTKHSVAVWVSPPSQRMISIRLVCLQ